MVSQPVARVEFGYVAAQTGAALSACLLWSLFWQYRKQFGRGVLSLPAAHAVGAHLRSLSCSSGKAEVKSEDAARHADAKAACLWTRVRLPLGTRNFFKKIPYEQPAADSYPIDAFRPER